MQLKPCIEEALRKLRAAPRGLGSPRNRPNHFNPMTINEHLPLSINSNAPIEYVCMYIHVYIYIYIYICMFY